MKAKYIVCTCTMYIKTAHHFTACCRSWHQKRSRFYKFWVTLIDKALKYWFVYTSSRIFSFCKNKHVCRCVSSSWFSRFSHPTAGSSYPVSQYHFNNPLLPPPPKKKNPVKVNPRISVVSDFLPSCQQPEKQKSTKLSDN